MESTSNICSKCGTPLVSGGLICPNCGEKEKKEAEKLISEKVRFIHEGRLIAEMTKGEITEAILEIDDIGRKYSLEVMPYKEAVVRLSKVNPFNLAMAYISLLEMFQKMFGDEERLKRKEKKL